MLHRHRKHHQDRLMDGWSFEGYVPVETRGIGDIETLSLIFQKEL